MNLAESIDTVSTFLLCVEESYQTCHRSVIAGAVAERLPRVAIVHLQSTCERVAVVGCLYMTSTIGKRGSASRQAAAKSAVPTSPLKSE